MTKSHQARIGISGFSFIFLLMIAHLIIQNPAFFIRGYILSHGEITKGVITHIRHAPKEGLLATVKYKDKSGVNHNVDYDVRNNYEHIYQKLNTGSVYPVELHVLPNIPFILVVDEVNPDTVGATIVMTLAAFLLAVFFVGIIGFPRQLFKD